MYIQNVFLLDWAVNRIMTLVGQQLVTMGTFIKESNASPNIPSHSESVPKKFHECSMIATDTPVTSNDLKDNRSLPRYPLNPP